MNLLGKIDLVIEKDNKQFVFTVPMGTSYKEAYEALEIIAKEVIELDKKSADQTATSVENAATNSEPAGE